MKTQKIEKSVKKPRGEKKLLSGIGNRYLQIATIQNRLLKEFPDMQSDVRQTIIAAMDTAKNVYVQEIDKKLLAY